MRLLFTLPIDADNLVVFVILQVVLTDFICEERQFKVETEILVAWIIKPIVLHSVNNIHYIKLELQCDSGSVLE